MTTSPPVSSLPISSGGSLQNPDLVRTVRTVADIRAAKAEGRVGLIYGFQNATAIENDLRLIGLFADIGVRIFQLTWNAANLVGDSCQESRGGGLTAFGRAVVRELNACAMLIDVSHCDERTSLDAMELSSTPVAITHANPLRAANVKRNKSDAMIRALAEQGGVMGIVAIADFLADDGRPADLARYCDQIDHVAQLVGIDHVAIGSDFTERLPREYLEPVPWGAAEIGPCELESYVAQGRFPFRYATGLESAADLPNVTEELLRRGYADGDVQKILGLNWLRLFDAAWQRP